MAQGIDMPTTFDEAKPLLRLRPLGASPLALRATAVANAGGSHADVDVAAPIAADLLVGAYLDLPTANVPVSGVLLERWGVGIDAVLDAAKQHLAGEVALRTIDGVTIVEDPSLAAAALWDSGIAPALRPGVTPFVLVPTQQHLIVTDADDAAAIERAIEIATSLVRGEDARIASRMPLVLRGHEQPLSAAWEEASVEDSSAARAFRHVFDGILYGQARGQVSAAHDRMGIDDVIVAELQVGQKPSGETIAMAALTDDAAARTFLPLGADEVVLVRVDGSGVTQVPMASLRAIPGLAEPVHGLAPAYLEVRRFPEELAPR